MKKKSVCLLIFILYILLLISGCKEISFKDKILSAVVSDISGYNEIAVNSDNIKFDYGKIEAVYKKKNSYIIYSIGYYGYNGDVELVINIENGIIKEIKGINIKETEGYGSRAFEDNFLKQFKGIEVSDIDLFQGGSKPQENVNIIYVTHATRTSKAVVFAVNAAVTYYKNNF